MKVTEELYFVIVDEIARLSMAISKEQTLVVANQLGTTINCLTSILAGRSDISDFHEQISLAPESMREYYYKLLYLIK